MARSSTPLAPATVIVFGSQGTSTLFSHATARTVEQYAAKSAFVGRVLSSCHSAFLAEASAIKLETSSLRLLRDFIRPPRHLRKNHIIQASLICLYQLVAFAASVDQTGRDYTDFVSRISEALGFCSGLLPACAVAAARREDDYIAMATNMMRASVCIACELHIRGTHVAPGSSQLDCWNLVISGLGYDALKAKLAREGLENVRVCAVINKSTCSVSGPPAKLRELKSLLNTNVHSQFAPINCWYHGGSALEPAVDSVIQRLRARGISFPHARDLTIPLRSSFDGKLFDSTVPDHGSLAKWVVRQMAVLPMNWIQTAQQLNEDLRIIPSLQEIEILSYGPKMDAFVTSIRASSSVRVRVNDHSPFAGSSDSDTFETDIAIVGKAFDLPGAQSDDELLDLLSSSTCMASEIPKSRFNVDDYFSEDSLKNASRTMGTKFGAFLKDISSFDHSFFQISPREAKSIDPQQRLLLRVAKSALEDSGYVQDSTPSFQRDSIGCYFGVATGDYTDNLKNDIDVFYSPGTLRAFLAGRVSYFNRFSGPSIVTDTACSSSIVSVYQACRALVAGDCTTALAGGVNTISSPDMYLGLSRAHFLSNTGCCKPFDDRADGYCRAEGCAVFVLKRLSDAIQENDHIHGVIKGIGVSNSGNASSITHPHPQTQVKLMDDVLKLSNVDAESVSVVEAHGTGTQAGDAGEMQSLHQVFGGDNRSAKLRISSIKGNIGHAEAASGGAGLAKLLLMLQKRQVYPQASCETLNTSITDYLSSSTTIPRSVAKWERPEGGRLRALLNNFGASGSNAALVLEEYSSQPKSIDLDVSRSKLLFNLSANTDANLKRLIRDMRKAIESDAENREVQDLCYSASARRQIFPYKVSIQCESRLDIISNLSKLEDETFNLPKNSRKNLVFIFSGQGGSYKGMGQELLSTSSLFRNIIFRCDKIARQMGAPSIMLFLGEDDQGTGFDKLDEGDQITVSHAATVALEYALGAMMLSWGIKPSCVIGHSIGEYAALALASAISLEDAMRIVVMRASLLSAKVPAGKYGMIAAKMPSESADALIRSMSSLSGLEVACENSLDDCVVSGPTEQLHELQNVCLERSIKSKRLSISFGFHSSSMQSISPGLEQVGAEIKWSQPTIPIASSLLGRMLEKNDFSTDYFARQTCERVRFVDATRAAITNIELSETAFVEVGPHPITLPMISGILENQDSLYISTLRRDQKPWTSLTAALRTFYLNDIDVAWREVFSGMNSTLVPLPGHPLSGTEAWVPYKEATSSAPQRAVHQSPHHRLLVNCIWKSNTNRDHEFVTSMSVLEHLIKGHHVGGASICPASTYHELCLEAVAYVLNSDDIRTVTRNMKFISPLVYEANTTDQALKLHLKEKGDNYFSITISSLEPSKATIFFEAELQVEENEKSTKKWGKEAAIVKRQVSHILSSSSTSTFQKRVLYDATFSRVVQYAPKYQTLSSFVVAEDTLEAWGKVTLPEEAREDGYVLNPIFVDTLLHAAGFVANTFIAERSEIYVCANVGKVETATQLDPLRTYSVYTSLYQEDDKSILADSIATNERDEVVAVIEGMVFKRLRLEQFHRLLGLKPKATAEHSIRNDSQPLHSNVDEIEAQKDGPDKASEKPKREVKSMDSHGMILRAASAVSGFSESELPFNKQLESLGIDSLMRIELTTSLNDAFKGMNIDRSQLSECETLQEVLELVDSCFASPTETDGPLSSETSQSSGTSRTSIDSNRDEPIQKGVADSFASTRTLSRLYSANSGETPLCLVHDGSGLVLNYKQLQPMNRDVWALSDPSFGKESALFPSIEQMAEHYASQVIAVGLTSVIVGGWSFGGVVALEMTKALRRQGIDVQKLLLIDSPFPVNHVPLPKQIVSYALSKNTKSSNKSLELNFTRCADMLKRYSPRIIFDTALDVVMLQSEDVLDTQAHCGVEYRWLSDQKNRKEAIDAWGRLLKSAPRTYMIPGNHFEAFDARFVERTREAVHAACDGMVA